MALRMIGTCRRASSGAAGQPLRRPAARDGCFNRWLLLLRGSGAVTSRPAMMTSPLAVSASAWCCLAFVALDLLLTGPVAGLQVILPFRSQSQPLVESV